LKEIELFADGLDITFVKIDVEGMETAVLKGGRGLIKKYKPDLFIEVSNPKQMKDVLEILNPIGYRPITAWAATPVWHFVHNDNLNILRIIRLWAYIFIYKVIKPLLSKMKYRFKLIVKSLI
jgi:hypothetical protein